MNSAPFDSYQEILKRSPDESLPTSLVDLETDVFFAPTPIYLFTPRLTPTDCKGEAKRLHTVPKDLKKKFENVRQTLIRHFKKSMRSLLKASTHKQLVKTVKKIYSMRYPSLEDITELKNLLDEAPCPEYFQCKISYHSERFKSCNNAYVKWFFSNETVKQLYMIHHKLSKDKYLKILRISDLNSPEELTKLFEFIENLPIA